MEKLHLKVSELHDLTALRVGQKMTVTGVVHFPAPPKGSKIEPRPPQEYKFQAERLDATVVLSPPGDVKP